MNRHLDIGNSGDSAVDTASAAVGIDPGSVHLGPHEPSRPGPDLLHVVAIHLADHDLWNASDRDITEEALADAAANQADHQRSDRHFPSEIHLLQTNRLSRHTHVQQVGSGGKC